MTIENDWTKKIAELEEENRRFTAALKSADRKIRVELDLSPVWDTRHTLNRLTGIIGAVIYLIHREEDDTEKEEILTALVALQETLAESAEDLDNAIKGMNIVKEKAA